MSLRARLYAVIVGASLSVVLAGAPLIAHGQSGRAAAPVPRPSAPPTPTPSSTPSPTPSPSQSQTDAGPDFAARGDEYRLIFPTVFEAGKTLVGEEAFERARVSKLHSFVEHLNSAGAQGYEVTTAVYAGIPVAVVRLGEGQYEYTSFLTNSTLVSPLLHFESTYAGLSRRGFRLKMRALVERSCQLLDPENSIGGESCTSRHLFLLGRKKGDGKPGQHRLVDTAPGWGANPALELTAKINDKLAQGFYPTHVLTKSEILLEQTAGAAAPAPDKTDVRVVNSSWREDVQEKVNELAKQGYRLALTNNGIAVMYRRGGDQAPVKYVWLRAKDKNFEKELAKLQQGGAVYRMTYPDEDGSEARLVFERQAPPGLQRLEYRVLKFAFDFAESSAEKRVRVDLAPSGKEALQTLRRLVKEGFAVRDLFYSKEVGVILERPLRRE